MIVKSDMGYVADGEDDGDVDGDDDGDEEADADGEDDGDVDGEVDEITVPTFPSSTSQRYEPAEIVTEISDRKSLASANVAVVSSATLRPAEAVTTTSPPPSVFNRTTKRMPAFVGVASVRVSFDAPDTISQICKSAVARMMPASPGSRNSLGPRYRS